MTAPTLAARKSLEPFLRDSVEFYPHQTDGVRWAINKDSFILADDMGLGKSLQALTLFCIDCKVRAAQTCIVVAPVTLRDNWAEEIEKFTRLPYLLLGQERHPTKPGHFRKLTPKKRAEQLEQWLYGLSNQRPRVLIVNYEQLNSPETEELFKTFQFDLAIFDEAHYMKNPTAKRTKACLALRSTRSFMLTGTPMLNQVNELWALLHKCDPRKFPDYYRFMNRYCVFGGYENREIKGVKNQKELTSILGEFMIRRLKKNVLKRDEPTYQTIYVSLSPTQQELYDSVIDDLLLPGLNGEEDKFVDNDLAKFTRARQICGTPRALGPDYPDDSWKLDRVAEVIADFAKNGEKVIFFTQIREVQIAVNERLKKLNKKLPVFMLHGGIPQSDRVPTVNRWSAVQGPAVINCMIQVAGVGLNMQAASTIVRADKLFVPGLNKQGVDRADRIGQTEPVQVIDFLTRDTIEQRVEEILSDKEALNEVIIEGGVNMGNLMKKLKERLKANA